MEKHHAYVLEMLPCISAVTVILHTVEPPRKTKIGSRDREVRENGIPLYKHLAVNFMSKLTGITHLVKVHMK